MYTPFRCVGHVSQGPAFVFRIGTNGYVATSIGRSFNIYDVSFLQSDLRKARKKKKEKKKKSFV
jgi:hypothetical protein